MIAATLPKPAGSISGTKARRVAETASLAVLAAAAGAMSIHTMRISAHTTGTRVAVGTRENLLWMDTQIGEAAKLLAHAKVDVIFFGCTAGGVVKGPGADQDIIRAITDATGTPGGTTIAATCDALRALGATQVSVASPYEQWLNDHLRSFLEKSGFRVNAIEGFAADAKVAVGPQHADRVTPQQVAELAAAFVSSAERRLETP